MAKEKICGIYKIENLINGKKYIGQSTNIKNRLNEHKRKLISNKHVNKYLQNAFDKYGEDNFIFDIVEICSVEKLDEKEIYYIKKYNSYKRANGYNIELGGCFTKIMSEETKLKLSIIRQNPSEETRRKISIGNTGKRHGETTGIYKIKEIEHICSLLEQGLPSPKITRLYGYNRSTVEDIKQRRIWTYISEKYNFDKTDSYQDIKVAVVQYDLNFNKIAEFDSIEQASKITNSNTVSIGKSCRNELKVTNNNSIWFYKGEDTEENIRIKKEYIIKKDNTSHFKKKIVQLDLFNNIINIWNSLRTASRELNIDHSAISKVCRGIKKTSGGFKWMYYEDYKQLQNIV